ncbi:MAG: C13 family peptidase [Promethearchaeota archaeon]
MPNAQLICINNTTYHNSTDITPRSAAARLDIGAWIIIGGDRESDHACVEQIKRGCDLAYFILASRDVDENDIKYLGPDPAVTNVYYTSLFQDDIANLANIEDAITNWAASRVGPGQALGMYMFDHGGTNSMSITGPNLAASSLSSWLDDLESATSCNRMVIIYEACHAGSFIDDISKSNRIVITSTDTTHNAYASEYFAYFSEEFFSSIVACKTIGECFEDAVDHVIASGYGGIEIPLIDDNHDDTGNEVDAWGNLPNGGDGSDALNYWIGTGTNCPPETFIFQFPLRAYISVQAPTTPIWVVVSNHTPIEKVYVRVLPPDWVPPTPPDPDEDGIVPMIQDNIKATYVYDDGEHGDGAANDGRYGNTLYLGRLSAQGASLGDYKVVFHVLNQNGTVAKAKSTLITVNEDGSAPPDTTDPTITITNPESNAGLSGIVNITAEGDDDQALDRIEIYLDGTLVKSEIMPDYYPYPEVIHSLDTADYSKGLHNITARAVDNSSNSQETTILVTFEEDKIPGFQITLLFSGTLLGVIIMVTLYVKRYSVKKIDKRI